MMTPHDALKLIHDLSATTLAAQAPWHRLPTAGLPSLAHESACEVERLTAALLTIQEWSRPGQPEEEKE